MHWYVCVISNVYLVVFMLCLVVGVVLCLLRLLLDTRHSLSSNLISRELFQCGFIELDMCVSSSRWSSDWCGILLMFLVCDIELYILSPYVLGLSLSCVGGLLLFFSMLTCLLLCDLWLKG